jgi:four helix bundle protein
VKDYRTLQVWQRSHALTLEVYSLSKRFPKEELFGLTGQLRRCCSSIPANLAEGCGRDSDAEPKRFVDIAYGSASEAEYFILLAHELGYLDSPTYRHVAGEISELKKMLGAFARKLKADR